MKKDKFEIIKEMHTVSDSESSFQRIMTIFLSIGLVFMSHIHLMFLIMNIATIMKNFKQTF